ncbi:MAG TPA: response regulator transcription factor [Terriglobales bacterium]|nr:response regulator transcription factor [Terriglobales bacterium]
MPTVRILIADDHEIVRQGLRALLESRPGWEVCGEACDGWEAVKKAAELHPDVIALDIGMPNLNGLDAARQILHNDPRQKILFLTIYESEQLARSVAAAGAKGLLLKSDAGKDLINAVDALQRNSMFFSQRVGPVTASDLRGSHRSQDKDVLTRRERQVVQLLAEGKSTKEVASVLDLSVKTAETHRSNIMSKLGLHSVSELVLYAVRNNIVQALSPVPLPATNTGIPDTAGVADPFPAPK